VYVAVCCRVLQCVAVRCRVLPCVVVCLWRTKFRAGLKRSAAEYGERVSVLQCVAVSCSELLCVAVCCRLLQFVCGGVDFELE